MGAYTKLEAVNRMFTSAGLQHVSDLENNGNANTSFARRIVEQVTDDIQNQNIHASCVSKVMRPDANGRLMFSNSGSPNANKISEARLRSTHISSDGKQVIVAYAITTPDGVFLFNQTDNTDVWADEEYMVEVRYMLPFEHLETHYQLAVIARASRLFQAQVQGDDVADRYLAQEEALAMATSRAADARNRNMHIRNSTSSAGFPNQMMRGRLVGPAYNPRFG